MTLRGHGAGGCNTVSYQAKKAFEECAPRCKNSIFSFLPGCLCLVLRISFLSFSTSTSIRRKNCVAFTRAALIL